jgi:SAM-dependent methyltransferase
VSSEHKGSESSCIFDSARWYEVSIHWAARLEREIPVLRKVLGPPGELGVLDAGCGTGHQTVAMAQAGYRMTGLDASEAMLRLASARAAEAGVHVAWAGCAYDGLPDAVTHLFDGVYCIGNSLAAAGSADGVRGALAAFAAVLRPGGRLFVQILNFAAMREESPCVRGPRVARVDGTEYVSVRVFQFAGDHVDVVNSTIWKEADAWRQQAGGGRLYPATLDEMRDWLTECGFRVEGAEGDYQRTPFDPSRSGDLIIVATRNGD